MSKNQAISTKDFMGTLVTEGTVVRVLRIDPSVFDTLDTQEKEQVESMLGEAFSVYEVDQYGRAWVEKWWHEDEAHAFSHSLALEPSDMKVASDGRA
jgi:hypothetical protein